MSKALHSNKPNNQKIDEKQMLQNIKQEVLQLGSISPTLIFDPNGKSNHFFN